MYRLKLLKCPLPEGYIFFVIILFITVLVILLFITACLYNFFHMQSSPHLHIYYCRSDKLRTLVMKLFCSPSKTAHTSSRILVNNSQSGASVRDHAEGPSPGHCRLPS